MSKTLLFLRRTARKVHDPSESVILNVLLVDKHVRHARVCTRNLHSKWKI